MQNTPSDWLAAGATAAAVLAVWLVARLLRQPIQKFVQKTNSAADDLALHTLKQTKLLFVLAAAIYFGAANLALPPNAVVFIRSAALVSLALQAGFWTAGLINRSLDLRLDRELQSGNPAAATNLNALRVVAKIILWAVVIVLALDNVPGVEISALIASLGIGGIAVALAMQNILGDLFASLVIAMDKPFVIGDSIFIGEFSGTIEHIGLKSTRVRLVSGEQLIVSNTDMLNSRVRNMQRLERRRVVLPVRVASETAPAVAAEIPARLKEIIAAQPQVTLDRVHLKQIGDHALLYEAVYFVETADFVTHMDIQQAIWLAIHIYLTEAQISEAPLAPILPRS